MRKGKKKATRRRSAWAAALVALSTTAGLAGCGLAANPQPPTLWLPAPVKDLTARRVGEEVHLHWTMPSMTTDKVALKGDQKAHFCWNFAPGFDARTCQGAGDAAFSPGKPADTTVQLPADLKGGTPRAVAFFVELQNHAGKTAGPSNAGWVASGNAPTAVADLRLDASAQGVVLHWEPSAPGPGLVMRIHRTLIRTAATPKPDVESNGLPPAQDQTLEVDLDKADRGGAVDHDAAPDHEWKYWLERVVRTNADGHALETAGPASPVVDIDAKDVFPPGVPMGLVAVADAQARTMDLSWTPDSDVDIAGYVVYRRDETTGGKMERITSRLVVPPSYSDTNIVPGHRYAYAVSAVDLDGNESAQSPEVEEEMPH